MMSGSDMSYESVGDGNGGGRVGGMEDAGLRREGKAAMLGAMVWFGLKDGLVI